MRRLIIAWCWLISSFFASEAKAQDTYVYYNPSYMTYSSITSMLEYVM